jgi:threonine aldolase
VDDLVDLRSDTITRPTAAMRRAIAEAEVGDDVYRQDPTVNRLQERAAELLGHEAALLFPSGTMANQVALRVLAGPGTEVLVDVEAHLVNDEGAAGALLGGVQFRTVATPRGLPGPEEIATATGRVAYHPTVTALVAVEQTHNRRGGIVHDLDDLRATAEAAREGGARLYIDGARLFNAATARGEDVARHAELADGVMFSLSKGLGAPVGSVLTGSAALIEEARSWRARYGGAMRQAGVLAAAGLHALERHVERLGEDHANARFLARTVAEAVPEAVEPATVETNMVYVATGDEDALELAGRLYDAGVAVGPVGARSLRLVTHLDVDREDCRRAADLLIAELSGP